MGLAAKAWHFRRCLTILWSAPCMAAIPTIEEEDAKRPNREREKLVGERTRTVNRIKATLARLGILPLKPTLRKAEERLAGLRTREGAPLPVSSGHATPLSSSQRAAAKIGTLD